jgi:hypothetical protein
MLSKVWTISSLDAVCKFSKSIVSVLFFECFLTASSKSIFILGAITSCFLTSLSSLKKIKKKLNIKKTYISFSITLSNDGWLYALLSLCTKEW